MPNARRCPCGQPASHGVNNYVLPGQYAPDEHSAGRFYCWACAVRQANTMNESDAAYQQRNIQGVLC